MTSSEEDFDVLERVFLRVGSADTDEQLESAINKFLIPVIVKLSTTDEEARNKIMELLSHINRRIKRTPNVQLPVETLLTHYVNPDASTFIVNFSILYIKLGFPRLPVEKKMELVPLLLSASGRKHRAHQDSLFFLLTSMVGHFKKAAEKQNHREFFKLDENPELMKNFCNYMLDVILLPYTQPSQSVPENLNLSGSQFVEIPPGMSQYGYKRVTAGDHPMTGESLEEIKLNILKFLATGILPAEDIICHFIIGSSDPRYMVAEFADDEVKKVACNVNWSNTNIASRLFHIYLGTPEGPPDKKHPIPAAHRVVAASTRIRLKILPYLSKLEKNAILFPLNIQVVFDTLHSESSNLRLRIHALNFALTTVKRVDDSIFKKMGGMLYTGLLKVVLNDGDSVQLRVAGYTVLGQIVKRMPCIINKNLTDLQIFFAKLDHHRNEIRTAVRDALIVMIDSFRLFLRSVEVGMDVGSNDAERMELDSRDNDPEELEKVNKELANRELMMLEFLGSQVESRVPMARFVATKYLSAVFDTDHAPSRYLLLLAVGDPDPDVSSFALKALYTDVEWGDYKDKLIPLPDFLKMVKCVHEQANIRIQNEEQRVTIQNIVSPFIPVVFDEILTFLRLCMVQSSSVQLINKEDMFTHPCEHSPTIRQFIFEINEKNPTVFDYYLKMIEMMLLPYVSEAPIICLAEVLGTCPEIFTERFAPRFQQFMNLLNHPIDDVKDNVGFILSVLAVRTMNEDKLNEITKILLKSLGDRSAEVQKGAIFALGYIFQGKIAQLTRNGVQYDPKSWPLDREIFFKIVKNLDDPDSLLISATCTALSQIMKCAPLPLPDNAPSGFSKYSVFKKLLDIANSGKLSSKTRERAIRACGIMCIGDKFPFSEELIEKLVDISKQAKEVETHLSVAEAIIFCLEGTSSPEKRDVWIMRESDYVRPPIPEENLYLLSTLLDELLTQVTIPNPNFRQAISVFLLSILKKLHFTENVKSRLPVFQSAFMELLSDNEFVQDIASKGLALVYEISSPEKKKELVTTLVNQLLSGRRTVLQVSKDTRLFEEGQVAHPSVGNLITYKEICSLASDVNQPDLVYSFMHLANQNVAWNSRKGAALGFRTIAMYAQDVLDEYLPKIIPRLYRYTFDPMPRIHVAMNNIWRTLVKDTNKALNMYFHEILEDLAANIISDQWRVRLSCATALIDFFRSRQNVVDSLDILPSLMSSLFRVVDDVHEATRLAAQSAANNITKHCLEACDTEKLMVDEKTVLAVLSVFEPGLTSGIPEVRSICLRAVSRLVDAAGAALKPSLPTLMVALLESAGDLDSLGLSYLSNHLTDRDNRQDIIDDVRANLSKCNYSSKTIEKCIQFLEPQMLEIVVPKAIDIIRDVKLESRIAAAHMIVLLSQQMRKPMEPHMGKALVALLNGLQDRNPTIRRTFACNLGEVLRTAKLSSREKLFRKLSDWYFDRDDYNVRTTIPIFLQSAALHNGEILRNYLHILVPMIFFAIHEKKVEGEDNSHVTKWEEAWNDISLGYESTIKRQFDEILNCLDEALKSLSWTTKAQAGRCIQTIALKLGAGIDTERRNRLISMSLKALEGRAYRGKEDIIHAVVKLVIYAGHGLKGAPLCKSIADVLLRESKKSQSAYRRHSFEALGRVLEIFDHLDYFHKVYELSRSIIGKVNNFILKAQCDDDDFLENVNSQKKEMCATINVMYICLGKSWPKKKDTQRFYHDVLLNECCDTLEQSPRDVQVSILIALHYYIDKLYFFGSEYKLTTDGESSLRDILQKVSIALHFSLGIVKNVTARKEALNITATLARKLIITGRDQELTLLTEFLRVRFQELEKDESPEVRMRLLHVKEILRRGSCMNAELGIFEPCSTQPRVSHWFPLAETIPSSLQAGVEASHLVRCNRRVMRKTFFFLLILLLIKREVSAIMEFNQQNFENTGIMMKGDSQRRRYLDEDPYEEGSSKWNIDLSDMLNFDSRGNDLVFDDKPLTQDELRRLIRANKMRNRDAGEEYDENAEYEEDEINALLEEDEELKMQVQEYLLRYVNLFLNLLELKDKRAMGEGDEEIVDFDFVITSKDLRALQDLAENFEERSVFDQLYVIDSIISKGIRVKEKYSFYQDFMSSFTGTDFSKEFFISKGSYFYIFVGVGVSMILAKNLIGLSYKFIAFILVNNMILMEGLFNYFRKIKEANIADYVDRMKYNTEYDACNPEGQSIFGKLYDMFYENKCLTYHKNLQLSRADSIFPLESILNAYAFYFVELPCKVLGSGINSFAVSVNAYLPSVVRQLGEVTTQFCVMGFLLLAFILYFVAPQFTFTFLGGRFHLNFGRNTRGQEPGNRNPRQYRRIRETTRAALNEIETENNNEEEAADHPEEDLDPFAEEMADVGEGRIENEEFEDSSIEDEIEILDEQAMTDDESLAPDEKNSSEDVETTEGLPSED